MLCIVKKSRRALSEQVAPYPQTNPTRPLTSHFAANRLSEQQKEMTASGACLTTSPRLRAAIKKSRPCSTRVGSYHEEAVGCAKSFQGQKDASQETRTELWKKAKKPKQQEKNPGRLESHLVLLKGRQTGFPPKPRAE